MIMRLFMYRFLALEDQTGLRPTPARGAPFLKGISGCAEALALRLRRCQSEVETNSRDICNGRQPSGPRSSVTLSLLVHTVPKHLERQHHFVAAWDSMSA